MKKFPVFFLCLALIVALLAPMKPVFATGVKSVTIPTKLVTIPTKLVTIPTKPVVTPNGVIGPSEREYRTEYSIMVVSDLNSLVAYATAANNQNNYANRVALATKLMFLCGDLPGMSLITMMTNKMILDTASDLDVVGTLLFCYHARDYLATHPGSAVYASCRETRLFTGDYYATDWHPIGCPTLIRYY